MSPTIHVNNTMFCEIVKRSLIRKSFPNEATENVANVFVLIQLDYCNSLYFGLPDYQIGNC